MSLAQEYRHRAAEAEGLSAQLDPRDGERWLAFARSWRELAERLEQEDIQDDRISALRGARG